MTYIIFITIFPILIFSQDFEQKLLKIRHEIADVKKNPEYEKVAHSIKKIEETLKQVEHELKIGNNKNNYDSEYELQELCNYVARSLFGKEMFKQKND